MKRRRFEAISLSPKRRRLGKTERSSFLSPCQAIAGGPSGEAPAQSQSPATVHGGRSNAKVLAVVKCANCGANRGVTTEA
ncbi:hypothetical protein EPI10_002815 [Gossypium australe]|uniref:Uncharacterized protein n=1 Tax=Gossypium australe TaxID=47621 RepID=A0A5B6VF62_9ROSI|nr:hypothetical protein EPI10_002815 [Gossypium australe]